MAKPATLDGYRDQYTVDCERVLVTLLRGLGPWKESVFLVGGLTPRYLVTARPPSVPAHAGTLDVDIVIDLQILADTAGTASDEVRDVDERQGPEAFETRTENGHGGRALADAPEVAGGRVEPLPTECLSEHPAFVHRLRHEVTRFRAPWRRGNRRGSSETRQSCEFHMLEGFRLRSALRSAKHVNRLVQGKVALTEDAALRIEPVLGASAGFWLTREARYREHVARLKAARFYAE